MYSFPQIEERDLDMLFIRSFGSCPGFSELFLKPLGWSGAVVTQVFHSVMDPQFGESDIVVLLEKDGHRYALLIENKVNAEAMPEQCLRYHKRGEQGMAQGEYQEYAVFMTAPQKKCFAELQKNFWLIGKFLGGGTKHIDTFSDIL